ncbi:MAG: hypothetical protein M3N95_06045 [Actinomycetota bacterium]|nr:hypothetical protein [Actinomycetota bacterium]
MPAQARTALVTGAASASDRLSRPVTANESCEPSALAAWAWALAGDDALPYATGETIVVSGGSFMH